MLLSKIQSAVNWRHAAGELLLIVAGILIALAISDWNDRRIQDKQEHALLNEVRVALETDRKALETNLDSTIKATRQIESLLVLLKNPPPYEPTFDRLFGAVYGIRVANLNTAAYETLKSIGLQAVSNRELRLGIARVFDHYYESIQIGHEIDTQVNIDLLGPYYMEHFKNLKFWESATPLDYAVTVIDDYFENIVVYRLTVLKSNQISSYSEVIAEMDMVLGMLDKELSH